MIAIRGATTVAQDTPEQIRGAVRELLEEIARANDLKEEQLVFLLFSNTEDIRSLYPAKAAREAGFVRPALFSAAEPEIFGSLRLCIRVMALAEKEGEAHHVYLRGASNLRRDLKKFSVALDGPSGSGKSTVAKRIAEKLGILYLDTGAMYRACALQGLRENISFSDAEAVKEMIARINLSVEYAEGTQHTFLGGEDVSEAIRRPEVSMAASAVSAHACVREKMVAMQREIASRMSCVLDGRDIGTEVLPCAELKFYVTASSAVRAKRRYDELKAKGFDVDLEKLREEIEERDRNDSQRAIAPLRKAEDAVLVDTSDMGIDEVVSFILTKIQEKV